MRTVSVLLRAIGIPVLAGCAIFPAAMGVLAQNADVQQRRPVVKPTESDREAARGAKVVFRKVWAGHKQTAVEKSRLTFRAGNDQQAEPESRGSRENADFVRYPGDLTNHGGKFVEFAESHDVYMLPNGSCPVAVCWGDPERFLADLGKSEFIHITDEYVGQRSSNRYTLGESAKVSFTPSTTPLTDNDMLTVIHAVASAKGQTGYGHIYHVFLPAGQDVCIDGTFTTCASNEFCAYHMSADFADIGHVLYSVEPYANVQDCQVRPGTPNGVLVDSTNDVLSHELIDTITDPDGDGWWNSTSGSGLLGEEIGDECVFVLFAGQNRFSDPAIISVHGRKYALQPEYSNRAHGCTATDE